VSQVIITFTDDEDAKCMFRMLNDAKNGNGMVFASWPGGGVTYSEVRSATSIRVSGIGGTAGVEMVDSGKE
jgi:hypothetical protein